jgi:hypothetical protein
MINEALFRRPPRPQHVVFSISCFRRLTSRWIVSYSAKTPSRVRVAGERRLGIMKVAKDQGAVS